MLNESQKLNQEILTAEGDNGYSAKGIKMEATRTGFGEGLLIAGDKNDQVVGVCADLTGSTKMDLFANKFPDRFVQVGVAEQNLVTVASGLAAMGKIPFTTSYAMFSPGRSWEQIRTTVCYNDQPVKIIGSHAGISVGPDGGTHQAIEDIAITQVMPNMVVVYPADAIEARKATVEIAENGKPSYLRLARNDSVVMTTEESPFSIGKANLVWKGESPEVAIIACGPLLYSAIRAAKRLSEEGIQVSVLNNHTIKPMDEEAIISVSGEAGAVVVVEEHQIIGGMGSRISQIISSNNPVPIEFVGIDDRFGQSGEPAELIKEYGMDCENIIEKVRKVISRK